MKAMKKDDVKKMAERAILTQGHTVDIIVQQAHSAMDLLEEDDQMELLRELVTLVPGRLGDGAAYRFANMLLAELGTYLLMYI